MKNQLGKGQTLLRRADISTKEPNVIGLEGRYPDIVTAIAKQTGFTPEEKLGESRWWSGPKIGAVIYSGTFPMEEIPTPAVLKIEAVEMAPDEITEPKMIQHAEQALVGSGIRPPKVYKELPWTNDYEGYSAVIMESVPTDHPVLPIPGTEEDIATLLDVRKRYREALQTNRAAPWVAPDFPNQEEALSCFVQEKFAEWKQTSNNMFHTHPFREPTDKALIDRAIETLVKKYARVAPEFQQGHFSHQDIVQVGDELVMFSNLYWSWRPPFYDAAFASHWYMYDLANAPGITIEQIDQQYAMWQRQYKRLTDTLSPNDKKLFDLTRMERLTAGLNLDALSISADPKNDTARHIVNQTRKNLTTLLDKLE